MNDRSNKKLVYICKTARDAAIVAFYKTARDGGLPFASSKLPGYKQVFFVGEDDYENSPSNEPPEQGWWICSDKWKLPSQFFDSNIQERENRCIHWSHYPVDPTTRKETHTWWYANHRIVHKFASQSPIVNQIPEISHEFDASSDDNQLLVEFLRRERPVAHFRHKPILCVNWENATKEIARRIAGVAEKHQLNGRVILERIQAFLRRADKTIQLPTPSVKGSLNGNELQPMHGDWLVWRALVFISMYIPGGFLPKKRKLLSFDVNNAAMCKWASKKIQEVIDELSDEDDADSRTQWRELVSYFEGRFGSSTTLDDDYESEIQSVEDLLSPLPSLADLELALIRFDGESKDPQADLGRYFSEVFSEEGDVDDDDEIEKYQANLVELGKELGLRDAVINLEVKHQVMLEDGQDMDASVRSILNEMEDHGVTVTNEDQLKVFKNEIDDDTKGCVYLLHHFLKNFAQNKYDRRRALEDRLETLQAERDERQAPSPTPTFTQKLAVATLLRRDGIPLSSDWPGPPVPPPTGRNATKQKAHLLALETGMGKTMAAVYYALMWLQANPTAAKQILWITAQDITSNTILELRKWGLADRVREVMKRKGSANDGFTNLRLLNYYINIVTIDDFSNPRKRVELEKLLFDQASSTFCVFDEVHKLYNPTVRTSTARVIANACPKYVALTATPLADIGGIMAIEWLQDTVPFTINNNPNQFPYNKMVAASYAVKLSQALKNGDGDIVEIFEFEDYKADTQDGYHTVSVENLPYEIVVQRGVTISSTIVEFDRQEHIQLLRSGSGGPLVASSTSDQKDAILRLIGSDLKNINTLLSTRTGWAAAAEQARWFAMFAMAEQIVKLAIIDRATTYQRYLELLQRPNRSASLHPTGGCFAIAESQDEETVLVALCRRVLTTYKQQV